MRAILIGHGSNASYWLDQLKRHPQTTLIAIVNDEADASFGDAGPPVFDSLDAALENTQANAVLLSGRAVFENADRALSAGLSVVLANSESMVRDDVRGLTAARNRGTGSIFAPRILQYQKCRKTVRRFLQSGRLGAIGLVSCIDRHGTMLDAKDFTDHGLHLVRFGASQPTASATQWQGGGIRHRRQSELPHLHLRDRDGRGAPARRLGQPAALRAYGPPDLRSR